MIGLDTIRNLKILIVDDLDADVELLEQVLKQAGYTNVTSTRDSQSVYDLHTENCYDLILLDLLMPGMDGFQVMENLKRAEHPVSVLVMTAQLTQKLRALEAGAKDFISKPYDLVEVTTRIRNLLESHLLYNRIQNDKQNLERAVAERTAELRQEIEQRKESEESLRQSDAENKRLKERFETENIFLHEDINFQEQLVSDLSHQLRTPLTSMRGAVELAMKKARSIKDYQAILESNLSGIDRITSLINTMLSLAKLDGHIERLQSKRCNLVELLHETIEELMPLWEEKRLHFRYRFQKNGTSQEYSVNYGSGSRFTAVESDFFNLEIDAFRLKQAFTNLLDNAYKYAPTNGEITVEVYDKKRGGDDSCHIVLMNNGPAIPKETLPHLFTRFFQGRPQDAGAEPSLVSPVSQIRGFGLGLSICRRIVEMHRGTIRAFNPAEGGTAFEIVLPNS